MKKEWSMERMDRKELNAIRKLFPRTFTRVASRSRVGCGLTTGSGLSAQRAENVSLNCEEVTGAAGL